MAATDTTGGRESDYAAQYWNRVEPVVLTSGEPYADGVTPNEVNIYDDREDVDQRVRGIKVQFIHNGPPRKGGRERRRRVGTLTFGTLAGFAEFCAELGEAADELPDDS